MRAWSHAAANNLRVFDAATEKDVAVIQAYAGYSDPVAKRGALFAITYMGKFVELRHSLKEAALSIRTEGGQAVAEDLADAFGPYGVPLTALTREEASAVAAEFVNVRNWGGGHGAIPRFLQSIRKTCSLTKPSTSYCSGSDWTGKLEQIISLAFGASVRLITTSPSVAFPPTNVLLSGASR